MAAAKRRVRPAGDGTYLVELSPGGRAVRMAAEPDDFDAHAFEIAADAAATLPRTARGGTRDLAPDDTVRDERAAATDAAMTRDERPAAIPTLAETDETRRYAAPPVDPRTAWDTVWEDPEERKRRIRAAALKGARVRHGADVQFYDPEKPVDL